MICKHGETENGYTTIMLEKDAAIIVFQKDLLLFVTTVVSSMQIVKSHLLY